MIGPLAGYDGLRRELGPRLACAFVAVLALLVIAIGYLRGPVFFIGALVIAVLVVRAHGTRQWPEEEEEATELDADFDPLAAQRKAYSPPSVVLGRNHEGQEL